MATLEIYGMDDLDAAFNRIKNIPEAVTTRALNEMADIAATAIRRSGEAMGVRDPESEVHILDKIVKRKAKITRDGGYVDISFSGTRTRGKNKTRNAEIAFVNEYGKRGQPARPFIGQAMNQNEEKIAAAGGDVLGDWIEKEYVK